MSFLVSQMLLILAVTAVVGIALGGVVSWILVDARRAATLRALEKERESLRRELELATRNARKAEEEAGILAAQVADLKQELAAARRELETTRTDLTARLSALEQETATRVAALETRLREADEALKKEQSEHRKSISERDTRIGEIQNALAFEKQKHSETSTRLDARVRELKAAFDDLASRQSTDTGDAAGKLAAAEVALRKAQMQAINRERELTAELQSVREAFHEAETAAARKASDQANRIQELNLELVQERKRSDRNRMADLEGRLERSKQDLEEKEAEFAARLRGVEGLLAKANAEIDRLRREGSG